MINRQFLNRLLVKTLVSILGAGVTYFVWMGVFLLFSPFDNAILEAVMWVAAPIATGAGFTLGITLMERRAGERSASYLRIMVWPLIGCISGAVSVYWSGPMLIVFGMFVLGTVGVVCREGYVNWKGRKD